MRTNTKFGTLKAWSPKVAQFDRVRFNYPISIGDDRKPRELFGYYVHGLTTMVSMASGCEALRLKENTWRLEAVVAYVSEYNARSHHAMICIGSWDATESYQASSDQAKLIHKQQIIPLSL